MNNCDEIRGNDGTYRLWLDSQAEVAFHKALNECLANLAKKNKSSSNIVSGNSQSSKPSTLPAEITDQESKIT